MNAPGLAEIYRGEMALAGIELPVVVVEHDGRISLIDRAERRMCEITWTFGDANALAELIATAINERGGCP